MSTTTLSATRARELVDDGHATALHPDRWPAPIRHDGRWWHQLLSTPDDADFVVAADDCADAYEGLLTRLQDSERALQRVRIARR